MKESEKVNILGYDISISIENIEFNKKSLLINTINPHSYMVAKNDFQFRESLMNSDILIPDGIGIVLAARILNKMKINRIAGADLHNFLLPIAEKNHYKVFYLGSMNSTLKKIKDRLSNEYPNINFGSYSPPFKLEFSEEDNNKMIEIINDFCPNILFIGMTAPKQEKWAYKNKELLHSNIIASIGAVFDFYAGTVKRAPIWMQKAGLEWLHRSLSNPKKLGKRNLMSDPKFIFEMLKYKFRKK